MLDTQVYGVMPLPVGSLSGTPEKNWDFICLAPHFLENTTDVLLTVFNESIS
jgi:hypothetical protein